MVACLLKNDPASSLCVARLTMFIGEPKRKRVRIGQIESHTRYPKPSDLTMSRVKPHESGVEARTL